MSEIRNLKPECIWRNFDELTKVPRPSGHLEKVQKFLLEFAKRVGVEAFQDAAGNIVMRKPASAGMENRKTAILQAHMDMVPQKDPKSTHNFETDPIETWIDGEWVRAKGTTLGADNGMGVAAIMAIMEDTTQSAASGSGFIYSSDGYIITNYHVIESANSIKVTLYDGKSYDAQLVGYDESNDVAVLKIDAKDLTPVTIGDSGNLNVGDSVIAIGNPLGELTFSLTSGAVSALDREVTMSNNVTMELIQTDCAINSGNSRLVRRWGGLPCAGAHNNRPLPVLCGPTCGGLCPVFLGVRGVRLPCVTPRPM